MGEKVTAKCNPKVCNFHGGRGARGRGGGGAGDAGLRAPPSPPLQGERARGGVVGSGWKLTRGRAGSRWRCPRCLGSHLPPYLSPPAPPPPKNRAPQRSERSGGRLRAPRSPAPSCPSSSSPPPGLLRISLRAAEPGQRRSRHTWDRLSSALLLAHPPVPAPPAHPHLSPSSSPPPSPPPPPPSSPAHVGRSSITSCNQCR